MKTRHDLHTVFAGELRREVRLDALPPLLELEDALALLLQALASSCRARDLDADLPRLSVRVGEFGLGSFAKVGSGDVYVHAHRILEAAKVVVDVVEKQGAGAG